MNLHCKKPQNQTHLSGSTWEKKMKLNILSFKTASQAIIWPLKVSKKESPTVTRRFFVEKKTRQLDIFGVGIGCGLIIGLLPVSEKQGLQLRKKKISWKRWPRIAAQRANGHWRYDTAAAAKLWIPCFWLSANQRSTRAQLWQPRYERGRSLYFIWKYERLRPIGGKLCCYVAL